jgi:hypothetical protein
MVTICPNCDLANVAGCTICKRCRITLEFAPPTSEPVLTWEERLPLRFLLVAGIYLLGLLVLSIVIPILQPTYELSVSGVIGVMLFAFVFTPFYPITGQVMLSFAMGAVLLPQRLLIILCFTGFTVLVIYHMVQWYFYSMTCLRCFFI